MLPWYVMDICHFCRSQIKSATTGGLVLAKQLHELVYTVHINLYICVKQVSSELFCNTLLIIIFHTTAQEAAQI